ncbi:hypothetical protein [Kumtagia ephedrae]|uniref:Flagellar protein FlgN n=1 Tax=Kumtagia ephedrae TaxID=2116701 RepID=A0A2P7SLJ1_9HYPH|nr:hypothetical protein [Mesorhizobium ephedrae]PSJ63358.1 hypothetical protein C7I84_06900 [Mesorhizobium ephedrae]
MSNHPSPALRTGANDAGSPGRPASLATIIARIEEAVDAETAGLRSDRDFDLASSNARKSRHLYELTRAMKGVGEAEALAEHRDGLTRLRDKLARNEATIRAHLSAVNEVATLMRDVIRKAEADGTYSASEFGYGT